MLNTYQVRVGKTFSFKNNFICSSQFPNTYRISLKEENLPNRPKCVLATTIFKCPAGSFKNE